MSSSSSGKFSPTEFPQLHFRCGISRIQSFSLGLGSDFLVFFPFLDSVLTIRQIFQLPIRGWPILLKLFTLFSHSFGATSIEGILPLSSHSQYNKKWFVWIWTQPVHRSCWPYYWLWQRFSNRNLRILTRYNSDSIPFINTVIHRELRFSMNFRSTLNWWIPSYLYVIPAYKRCSHRTKYYVLHNH